MKTFELLSTKVTINVEQLSKGLFELHEEDENKKAVLFFGMLDAKLCEMMEKGIKEKIIKQFEKETYFLFQLRIDAFIKEVQNEVTRGVYKYATIIS
tara:strand:- start:371 stop:661 length:291 start_codon:yes stop_codon:yes gene_type:complete